jgi:peptidoglycan/LPS O-acetylase OafA/YrhL
VHRESVYRADIDGLRAVAILPVLLFHAGVPGFGGGYVGVDVFFVISGFLITSIIAREIDEGRFSILRFYERRARRIMPALTAVIAAVLAVSAILYLPQDFALVPRSALAAIGFVSNLLFFTETGYFQGGAETKPLLHTWSLAVEEQFYIGFPVLLLLVARFVPAWRIAVVAGIAILSFAIAVATQSDGSGFAFYWLPPRAWELFVGALLALGAVPAIKARPVREVAAWCGLAAIAAAVLLYDSKTVFPGVAALPPVLGAAALLHCAPGTAAGRLLSTRALTFIGLISYSLYLWHWPVAVFTQYATDAPLGGWTSVAVIAASVALATLSWRFVEQPFRRPSNLGSAAVLRRFAVAMAALGVVSAGMMSAGGWPGRFDPQVVRLANASTDVSPMRDSHGVELAYAVSAIARSQGRSLIQRTHSSCPPVLGYEAPGDPRCAAANRQVFDSIRRDRGIGTVYLAAFWASQAYGSPSFLVQFDRTIAALVGEKRRVVIFGPVPPNSFDVPRRLAHLAAQGRIASARGQSRAEMEERTRAVRAVMSKWEQDGVRVIDPIAALCGPEICDIIRSGAPLYFDSHHLSVAGAELVVGSGGLGETASASRAPAPGAATPAL